MNSVGHLAYAAATAVVIGAHYGFLAYLLAGGFLSWRWPRSVIFHLAAGAWAVLIVVEHLDCPLTVLQNWLRKQVGEPPVAGFINSYVRGVLYPEGAARWAQLITAVLVLVSWIGVIMLHRGRRRTGVTASDVSRARRSS